MGIELKKLDNKLFYDIALQWQDYKWSEYPDLVDYGPFDIDKPIIYEWKNLDVLLKDKEVVKLLEELNAIKCIT